MNANKENASQYSSRDISHIKDLLKSQNILDYDPEIIPKLLDISYQLSNKILKDSHDFIQYFDLPEITPDIVQLMSKQLNDDSISEPTQREKLLNMARKKNSEPLPTLLEINRNPLHLPPPSSCLFAPVESLVPPKTTENQSQEQNFPPLGVIPNSNTQNSNQKSIYTIPASYSSSLITSSGTNNPPINLPLKRKLDQQ
ncbi:hypothetical protein HZS_389 [Henneguya salminicola]|nr:hypothetical protein HZS_389 [Henneguya salminicola]